MEVGIGFRAALLTFGIVASALYAVVSCSLGEDTEPSTGPGELAISALGLPTYQPPALYPLKETGETFNRGETLKVSLHDAIAHDPFWAYVLDVSFDPYTPKPAPSPPAAVQAATGALSEAEFDSYLQEAGVPVEWWADFKAIGHCESRWNPSAIGDGGNSLGLMQMWYGWAKPAGVTDLLDPVQNLIAAKYVREVRGQYGGGGGWTCANHLGIP